MDDPMSPSAHHFPARHYPTNFVDPPIGSTVTSDRSADVDAYVEAMRALLRIEDDDVKGVYAAEVDAWRAAVRTGSGSPAFDRTHAAGGAR